MIRVGEEAPPCLRYEPRGRGEPMLLLHGAGSSRRAWMLVMEFLAAERDVIAVDLPGHGDSQLVEEGMPPTPQNFARLMVWQSENSPEAIRRSRDRCAPQPSIAPRS